MSDQELVFLIAVTVVMPIVALWIIFSYQKARLKFRADQQRATDDNSLTTSELSSLIDESVASATTPLVERIELLEAQIGNSESTPAAPKLDLETGFEEEPEAEEPIKTLGRTRL